MRRGPITLRRVSPISVLLYKIYKGGFSVHSSVFHFVPCVSRSCLGYGYGVQLNERFVNIGVVAIRTSLRQSHHNELVYKLLLASNWPLQNNDHDKALILLYNYIYIYIVLYTVQYKLFKSIYLPVYEYLA